MVRVKNAVHVAVAALDARGHLRPPHHAAAQEDFLPRMAVFRVRQRADIAIHAILRVLADGAGVDNDAVRALLGVHDAVAARFQHAADALRVGLVLLTAVGIDKRARRNPLRVPVFLDFLADLLLCAKLLGRNLCGFGFQDDTSG